MRISNWAKEFKIHVIPYEERPDHLAGNIVYRVKDMFTTRDGSWNPSDIPGSVPQWACESHLRPVNADDYFDDAGADHHIFARVLDLEGKPVKTQDLVICWSDGFHLLGQPNFRQAITMKITPKEKSGWGNQPIWNKFAPDQGQEGAWCWCPEGASDVVVGGGLPYNWHISTFVVWQAERQPVNEDIAEEMRRQAVSRLTIIHDSKTAFATYARQHNLGVPITTEFDFGGYRSQGYANGIVYAKIGAWDRIELTSW